MRFGVTGTRLMLLLTVLGCVPLHAGLDTVFRKDFAADPIRELDKTTRVAEDKLASGGKALVLAYSDRRSASWAQAKALRLAGPVTIAVRLRGTGLVGLTPRLNLHLSLLDAKTSRLVCEITEPVYGVQVRDDAYRTVQFNSLLGEVPADLDLGLSTSWVKTESQEPPVLWLDWIEVRAHAAVAPYISRVEPDKTAYRPGQKISVSTSVVNPTAQAFAGSLSFLDLHGLEAGRPTASVKVGVPPGAVRTVVASWKARLPEAGRELNVSLLDGRKQALDEYVDFYGVAKDPSFLNTMGGGVFTAPLDRRCNVGYVGPASYAQSLGMARNLKALRLQRMEYFSWSYNELASFLPPPDEEPYLGNEGIWWQSLKKFKTQLRLLKDAGITPISYVNGGLWGPAAYRLYQKHPEWFLGAGPFDMESRAKYERRRELEFQQDKTPFFYCYLNPVLPEARRLVADQFIGLATEMGFEGIRWDVWNMSVSPGQRDLFGQEVAHTPEEADRLTAESIAAVKTLVATKFPDFTYGYNYGGPEEVERTPLTFAEKCRGRGWILDEIICTYQEKTSPFHYWDAYRDRIVGWGDHVRQLGGIYNPYQFRRGGTPYTVDHIYEDIFRLIGGGRQYGAGEFNEGAAGNLGLLAFRFSSVFFSWGLRLQPETQTAIRVDAPDTLWWKTMVLSNRSQTGRPQAIVHLVNSPVAREVEENPESLVRAPVANAVVTCQAQDGQAPGKGWLLTAEPLTPEDAPSVQKLALKLEDAGSGATRVTVPYVLYWKTVVFEY